jgi:beta-lactam-binding protein with PASTA domain
MPATTAAATATGTDRPALIVPDWKGKRLSVARREARKLGFNVKAIDEAGEPVPASEASAYRVRRQLTQAGTEVQPGADVEVRVREIFLGAAEGY